MRIRLNISAIFIPLLLLAACQTAQTIPPEEFAKLPDEEDKSVGNFIRGTVKVRPGVTLTYFGETPKIGNPIVLFLRGGQWKDAYLFYSAGPRFKKMGIGYISIGLPFGMVGSMPYWYRNSSEHVADMEAIMKFLRKLHPHSQIWLAGFSNGSISAANIATRTNEKLGGVVFLSSKTRGSRTVLDYPLNTLRIPVLAVAHNDDACTYTPPRGAQEIVSLASNSAAAETMIFDGGVGYGDPCMTGHYHGFAELHDVVYSK